MDDLQQERGVTFSEIASALKKRIWWVLGATALLTAVLLLLLAFWYNPAARRYTLTFTAIYPGSETMKYPDGTPFLYQELVSEENLQAAKETDERFASLNVGQMAAGEAIVVTAEARDVAGETGESWYTFTANGAYFPNAEIASDYLKALARIPVAEAGKIAVALDLGLDEEVYESADYEARIELLSAQRDSLLAQYDEWIERYQGSYAAGGSTLRNHRARVVTVLSEREQKALTEELSAYGYASRADIEERKEVLEEEKLLNERKITALSSLLAIAPVALEEEEPGTTVVLPQEAPSISQMLAALVSRNAEIERELELISETGYAAASDRFGARLKEYFDRLDDAATTLKSVSSAIFEQTSRTSFSAAKAAATGGVGLAVAGVAGFVLFFLVAGAVACAVGVHADRKAPEAPAEKPAEKPSSASEA